MPPHHVYEFATKVMQRYNIWRAMSIVWVKLNVLYQIKWYLLRDVFLMGMVVSEVLE